jgi:hypothetical protein
MNKSYLVNNFLLLIRIHNNYLSELLVILEISYGIGTGIPGNGEKIGHNFFFKS